MLSNKHFNLLLVFIMFSITLYSQNGVTFSQFPKDRQLYPRVVSTNKATIPIVAAVASSSGYNLLKLKLFKESVLIETKSVTVSYVNGTASINTSFQINAELSNYSVEVFAAKPNALDTWITRTDNIVAGDVYIINGQSNAIGTPQLPDFDNFSRSYTVDAGWNYINFYYVSYWAPHIAKLIIQNHNIPVAIFSKAEGAQKIDYFLKNTTSPYSGNYGALLDLLEKAGVKSNIRAAFWFQGETDAWETSTALYKDNFKKLYNSWVADYGISKCFMFQIRYNSCTSITPFIFEAQRQLYNEMPNVKIMSTTNTEHDGCHHPYLNGYKELGDRMFALVDRELYNVTTGIDIMAPDINKAYQSAPNEITLEMKNVTQGLTIVGTPWSDFKLEGTNATIVGGTIIGNNIKLTLSANVSNPTTISYYGHSGSANNWIKNQNNIGILTFYNFALTPAPSGSTNTSNNTGKIDLELNISSAATTWKQYEKLTYTVKIENKSLVNASGIKVSIPIPTGMAFSEKVTSKGSYDAWIGVWSMDSLNAGQNATLNITFFTLAADAVTVFAQVKIAGQEDIDSSPNNNISFIPAEDDEAAFKIGAIIAPPPVSDGVDIELSLSADKSTVPIYNYLTYTLTVVNKGNKIANNVVINCKLPSGILAFSNQIISKGNYDAWAGVWNIGTVGINETITLKIQAFTLVGSQIKLFAEVKTASPSDIDSTPGNSVNQSATEDDEATVLVNATNTFLNSADNQIIPVVIKNIYPNPSNAWVYINLNSDFEGNAQITFFDSKGMKVLVKSIYLQKGYNEIGFDLTELTSGTYYFIIGNQVIKNKMSKIVKI